MHSSTVLIVDDEKNVRAALQRTLMSDRLDILEAESAEEALDVLEHNEVKLIISDMRMPGMDGADLLKKVAEQYKGVRRMVLTGYGDLPRAIVAINEGGVQRYLTKPWDNDELRKVVTEELEAESEERIQDNRIESLRADVRLLSKKMKISTNLLSGTTEALRNSQYKALIRLQLTLAQFLTPLKAELTSRVQRRAERVAAVMQLDRESRETLSLASLLHRLGEFVLPSELINKCCWDMTDDELRTYHRYPEISAGMVDPADHELVAIISTHRQYLNGLGFPGKSTNDIPLGSRILCAVTEYEEMKLFKGDQMGEAEIRKIMRQSAGELYDTKVVEAMCRV